MQTRVPWLLSTYANQRPMAAALVTIAVVIAALLFGASMPLDWHHTTLENGQLRVLRGIDVDSWLIGAAVVALGFLVRFLVRPPAAYVKLLFTVFTVAIVVAMLNDYVLWQANAGLQQVGAYFGLGFYVAVIGMLALIAATAISWRLE